MDSADQIRSNGYDLNDVSFQSKMKSGTNQSCYKVDEVNTVESNRNNRDCDNKIEIRPDEVMFLVAGVGDPIGYQTTQSTMNLSKISYLGVCQDNHSNDDCRKIEYTISLTIWIIEAPEFLQVSCLKCPLKVDWVKIEMLESNVTILNTHLKQYNIS